MSALILHRGGRLATLDEIRMCKTPPPQGRWHPVSHAQVLDSVKEKLAGTYTIKSEQLALARNDARFFAVLNLDTPLAPGTSLSIGVRNSVDKSFPIAFACGAKVFICDNLSFASELMVSKRHTVNGLKHFDSAISEAVASLASYKDSETLRIQRMMDTELSSQEASHLLLSAYRNGIISALQLPKVCKEWEEPRYEDFKPRTAWSLFNAFTEILKPRSVSAPQAFVNQTIKLNALMLSDHNQN